MEKQEKTEEVSSIEKISPIVKKNIFLRRIKTAVEHEQELPLSELNRLKNIFSKKKFKGIEKCCYEVVIAFGESNNPELKTLAIEFNGILNNFCK